MRNDETGTDLQEHKLWTYYGLRYALLLIGFLLPPVIVLAGVLLHRKGLQASISAYYYVPPVLDALATRDLFVGGLVTVAFCLYAYKGYSDRENYLLNTAALCALGVALIPSTAPDTVRTTLNTMHTVSAISFFAFLALVCWLCANETVHLVKPKEDQGWFHVAYAITGSLMVLVVVLAVLTIMFRSRLGNFPAVFFLEAFGMWVFGSYWAVKTIEMRSSDAERKALDSLLVRTDKPDPNAPTAPTGPKNMKVMEKAS